MQRHTNSLR